MISTERADDYMISYQQGDISALGILYEHYREPLYAFLFRYTQDEQLSIDLVQDTFIKLQKSRSFYTVGRVQFKTYLFQIAYNSMLTKQKKKQLWVKLLPKLLPTAPPPVSVTDKISIRVAISLLEEKQRAVILLSYYHDLSSKEIADILQIPVGTVKSRLHTAIKQLKKQVCKEDFHGSFNEF
jgi:RNA polymerase sigma-70 factor (ECF subfamily)